MSKVDKAVVDYMPQIRKIVWRIARDERIVDDIVQECCLRIIEKKCLWKGDETKLRAWMNAIVKNLSIRLTGKYRHDKNKNLPLVDSELLPDRVFEFDDEERMTAQIRFIMTNVNDLPQMQKQVLFMHFSQGLTVTEISQKIGLKRATVSTHLMRALNRLKSKKTQFQDNYSMAYVFLLGMCSNLRRHMSLWPMKAAGLAVVLGLVGVTGLDLLSESKLPQERHAATLLALDSSMSEQEISLLSKENEILKKQLASLKRTQAVEIEAYHSIQEDVDELTRELRVSKAANQELMRQIAGLKQLAHKTSAKQERFEKSPPRAMLMLKLSEEFGKLKKEMPTLTESQLSQLMVHATERNMADMNLMKEYVEAEEFDFEARQELALKASEEKDNYINNIRKVLNYKELQAFQTFKKKEAEQRIEKMLNLMIAQIKQIVPNVDPTQEERLREVYAQILTDGVEDVYQESDVFQMVMQYQLPEYQNGVLKKLNDEITLIFDSYQVEVYQKFVASDESFAHFIHGMNLNS